MRLAALLLALTGLLGCQAGTHEVFAIALSPQPLAASPGRLARQEAAAPAGSAPLGSAVDVNHAGLAALERVSGIDVERAAAIVAGRPYRSKRELLSRGILTTAEYGRARDSLVAHGGGRRTRHRRQRRAT